MRITLILKTNLNVNICICYQTNHGKTGYQKTGRKQKFVGKSSKLTISKQMTVSSPAYASQPAGRQNGNIISIILTFSPVIYSFQDIILLFGVFLSLTTVFFKPVGGKSKLKY